MKSLIIDTTRKIAKILIDNDGEKSVIDMCDKVKHSEGLFLYLEKALFEAHMEIGDFDNFCGVVGPGSFTGIRVGMSVIKGFNKALGKVVIPLNVFEVLSYGVKNGTILLNSTSTTLYKAIIQNHKIDSMEVIQKDSVKDISGDIFVLKEEQDDLDLEYNNIRVIADYSSYYFEALADKLKQNIGPFEPLYLQLSQAEKNLK